MLGVAGAGVYKAGLREIAPVDADTTARGRLLVAPSHGSLAAAAVKLVRAPCQLGLQRADASGGLLRGALGIRTEDVVIEW